MGFDDLCLYLPLLHWFKFSEGIVVESETCICGFDNAGFVMGTSSTLFNQFLLKVYQTVFSSFIISTLRNILADIGEANFNFA